MQTQTETPDTTTLMRDLEADVEAGCAVAAELLLPLLTSLGISPVTAVTATAWLIPAVFFTYAEHLALEGKGNSIDHLRDLFLRQITKMTERIANPASPENRHLAALGKEGAAC